MVSDTVHRLRHCHALYDVTRTRDDSAPSRGSQSFLCMQCGIGLDLHPLLVYALLRRLIWRLTCVVATLLAHYRQCSLTCCIESVWLMHSLMETLRLSAMKTLTVSDPYRPGSDQMTLC